MSHLSTDEHEYLSKTASSEVNRDENLSEKEKRRQMKQLKAAAKLGIVGKGDVLQYVATSKSEKSRNKKGKATKEQPKKY